MLKLSFDCELFHVRLHTDANPSPDVLDNIMSRWTKGIREAATIAATIPVGTDDDDD